MRFLADEMSWRENVADFGDSVSAITKTRQGGRMEVDGILALVARLGITVETFVIDSAN